MTWMTLGEWGILVAVAFALRSTYRTTLQAMPGQLVFGRDMVLNVKHLKDYTAIKACKQQIICKNNWTENLKWILHHYQVGDLVMLENNRANKYEQPYSRPYHITQRNGTVCLKINAVMHTINIWCIHPFKTPNSNCGGECSMCWAKNRWEHVN
jgi:hypothetical protein